MRRLFGWRHVGLVAGVLALLAGRAPAQVCVGDCNGDGEVTVNELITGVVIALGSVIQPPPMCDAMDANHDGTIVVNELILGVNNALRGCPATVSITMPQDDMLVLAGTVAAEIALPPTGDLGSVVVHLDGADVTGELTVEAGHVGGDLVGVAPGMHVLSASIAVADVEVTDEVHFEAVDLLAPDQCEILNNAECLLPYPSSRFLVADSSTATGLRLNLPAIGLPQPNGPPVDTAPLNRIDGFSPVVQILMHFPQGVDLEASNASRLLPAGCCGQPVGPPWIDTRTSTERSLDLDSPSVLIDAATGERVLHWLENDAHAEGNPARQSLIMRPGKSLTAGHRYIVAMRNLKTAGGGSIVPEPAFAALRDRRPSGIAAINTRRQTMDSQVFDVLLANGIQRDDLVLAFDFTVQSERQLTGAMLSMRDQAYAWLDGVAATADEKTFTVTKVTENECTPDTILWRQVEGTFKSPLFLTRDPNLPGVGFLNLGSDGLPEQNGFTDASFFISIPCSLLDENPPVAHPILLGHGLFGRGSSMTSGIPVAAGALVPWTYVAGATDWRGLSGLDLNFVVNDIIGVGTHHLNDFGALPDRLRQGMLNTLVLSRMMKLGLFNRDTDTFQTPGGAPVFPSAETEMFYYGISLGGIMGTWLSALTPDIQRFGLDVPGINFSCLLQRSTQFGQFESLLRSLGLVDPMKTILGTQVLHELWVGGEPGGYARHITSDPLPGSGDPKRILMTPAWLDEQVSNQCTEIAARTLNLPNLVPASLQRELPQIPDREGPLDSAYVMYDTGAFDVLAPEDQDIIPPLANLIPSGVCSPHTARPFIPAGIRMLISFLRPGGQVESFCNGVCDAAEPIEISGGADHPCDPHAPRP